MMRAATGRAAAGAALALLAAATASAQNLGVGGALDTPAPAGAGSGRERLGFAEYLTRVGRGNLDLAAQRASVSVTAAQVAVARIFPDPQLSLGLASIDVSGIGAPTVTSLGIQETVELGGKRGARIASARHDLESAEAGLDDFLRTLRGDASDAFIDALAKRLVLERKRITQASLERLVTVNQERLRTGDIGEIALVQSRVESAKSRAEVLAAETDVHQAELALALRLGSAAAVETITPVGELRTATRSFDIAELITRARRERPDVRARRFALLAAEARVDLAHANRWIDLTLGLGWQHSFAVPNSPDPTKFPGQPGFDALNFALTLPLPFSRVYKGELQGAQAGQVVAAQQLRAVELHVEVEIRQAWSRYQNAVERRRLYEAGLLKDAERVLEAKLYEYQRGGAPLLEVLEAQRTVNGVYLDYIDALADHAHALVALEQAAGLWDVQF